MTRITTLLAVLALMLTACIFRPAGAASGWTDPFSSLSGWKEIDPLGDGKPSVSGGALRLAIPAGLDRYGRDHDNWPNDTPVNRTLRVTRPVAGSSWTFTTKLLNTDRDNGRFAGVLIQASADHFFRSDWDGDGSHVDLYVGTYDGSKFVKRHNGDTGGAAAQWQRIRKSGTTYTISTSTDGKSWKTRVTFTWKPTPTVVGLNVGNSGAAPAYTAAFDSATLTSP